MKNLTVFIFTLGFILSILGYLMVFVLKIDIFIANLLLIPPGIFIYMHYRKSKNTDEKDVTPE